MKLTVNNIDFNIDTLTVTEETATAQYEGTDFSIDNLFAINGKEVTAIAEDGTDLTAYTHCDIEFFLAKAEGAFNIYLLRVLQNYI